MRKRTLIMAISVVAIIATFLVLSFAGEPRSKPEGLNNKASTMTSDMPQDGVLEIRKVNPNERVREALDRYKAEQAKIPVGAVQEQMLKIQEKTAELNKLETPMPSISQETDGQGTKWNRLVYSSGEVRYEIAN